MPIAPNFRQVLERVFSSLRNAIRVTPSSDLIDPTGRQRVSEPYTAFSNKNIHSKNSGTMKEATSGGTETITYIGNESSVELTVGTANGEYAIRQSRHVPYVPGKGIRAQLTGKFPGSKANVQSIIGYIDDYDGFGFVEDENGIGIILRSSVSGSVVDEIIYQSDWNLDNLTGNGNTENPSGITLDISKVELFYMDALWQGVGNRRFGLDIDGKIIYVHKVKTANIDTQVYMMRASLPLRYEIRNVGTSASSTTLKEICCQVDSEGGFEIPGLEFAAPSTDFTTSVGITPTPILAIRLKTTLPSGKPNRVIARLLGSRARVSGNDAWLTMRHVHDADITGGTWISAGDGSAVEYNISMTAVTGSHIHTIDAGPVTGGIGGQSSAGEGSNGIFNEHGLISMDIPATTSQAFVIYANSYTLTSSVSASIKWTEFE